DAGAALVKKGDLSAAEAIEVFHESRFPDAREFLAQTWDFARKMIEQLQARGGGGAGVVDQGAVNVEEDHVEIVFRVPSRSTRTKTGRSPCFPRAGQASRLSHVVQRLSVRATTPGNCF